MQDPFRPNSNAQLMREAQVGFIVIGLLLCVLVYVAFYRLTNRSSRFDEIARNVAVAEPVDGDPYRANSFVQTEERRAERRARDKKGAFAAIEEFSAKLNSSQLQNPSPDEEVTQASHLGSLVEQKKRPIADPKTSSKTKPKAAATSFVPVAKQIPSKPVQTDLDLTKEMISKKQPKVAPPVLTSKFGSLGSQDFLPVPRPKKVKSETQPSGFEASIPSRSLENLNPVSHIPPKPRPPVADSIDRALTRPLPAPTVVNVHSAEVGSQSFPSQSHLDSKKINLKQPDESSLITQTSAFEPIKVAPRAVQASPQKQGKPAAKRGRTYTTKKGDSLWTIAQAVYGDGRYFRALHEMNLDTLSPSEAIPAGTLLDVSTMEELHRDYPDLCPREAKNRHAGDESAAAPTNERLNDELDQRFYRTQDGDTLFEVARQRLGQASRYLEIYDLNRFRIPETANHLTPLGGGIELLLPQ